MIVGHLCSKPLPLKENATYSQFESYTQWYVISTSITMYHISIKIFSLPLFHLTSISMLYNLHYYIWTKIYSIPSLPPFLPLPLPLQLPMPWPREEFDCTSLVVTRWSHLSELCIHTPTIPYTLTVVPLCSVNLYIHTTPSSFVLLLNFSISISCIES